MLVKRSCLVFREAGKDWGELETWTRESLACRGRSQGTQPKGQNRHGKFITGNSVGRMGMRVSATSC